ncbi:MAG: hypothetical protein M3442_12255 [Chloroflexota bacterium]|nr:hypothetical protein [Chloroflexota bacterium]
MAIADHTEVTETPGAPPIRSAPPGRRRRNPTVVVCAWCEANGHTQGAARAPTSAEWQAVSHEYARNFKRAGLASHGICPRCLPLVLKAWGLTGQ